jgi:hypothetical protein
LSTCCVDMSSSYEPSPVGDACWHNGRGRGRRRPGRMVRIALIAAAMGGGHFAGNVASRPPRTATAGTWRCARRSRPVTQRGLVGRPHPLQQQDRPRLGHRASAVSGRSRPDSACAALHPPCLRLGTDRTLDKCYHPKSVKLCVLTSDPSYVRRSSRLACGIGGKAGENASYDDAG